MNGVDSQQLYMNFAPVELLTGTENKTVSWEYIPDIGDVSPPWIIVAEMVIANRVFPWFRISGWKNTLILQHLLDGEVNSRFLNVL